MRRRTIEGGRGAVGMGGGGAGVREKAVVDQVEEPHHGEAVVVHVVGLVHAEQDLGPSEMRSKDARRSSGGVDSGDLHGDPFLEVSRASCEHPPWAAPPPP